MNLNKYFLMNSIQSQLILKGLKLESEFTVGNYIQDFLVNRYSKLKNFLIILLKDITQFYFKAVKNTDGNIKSIAETLCGK